MGNLVADAMLAKYPEAVAAITNSGGLRADIRGTPPSGGEAPGEITWGEVFAVLPFNNRAALATITGAQLREALLNGFSPVCNTAIATGRFPQVAGLKLAFHCEGTTPVIDEMALAPEGPAGPLTPIGDADSLRIVTNDFMLTGGDGYTAFLGGDRRPAARRAAGGRGRVHRRALAGRARGPGPHHARLSAPPARPLGRAGASALLRRA